MSNEQSPEDSDGLAGTRRGDRGREATQLPSGLYCVRFRARGKEASGVVTIDGARFAGGDSGMAYYGGLVAEGDGLRCEVQTLRHTQTGGIALLGRDDLRFVAQGRATTTGAHFSGATPDGQRFEFTLLRIPTPR